MKEQEYSSKATAINGKQGRLPAIFQKIHWTPGTNHLDYGGGTIESLEIAHAFLSQKKVNLYFMDKYNMSEEYNEYTKEGLIKAGGADTVTLSNVLNVIQERNERIRILRDIWGLMKQTGFLYIKVYTGTKKQQEKGGRKTGPDQYQNFLPLEWYLEECNQVFKYVWIDRGIIICSKGWIK